MKRTGRNYLSIKRAAFAFLLACLFLVGFVGFVQAADLRQTISLDGTWKIAEGTLKEMPQKFDRTVPVPGLADLAVPAFEQVGPVLEKHQPRSTDPRREAFWYQRTFTLPEHLPGIIRLKVGKATFGTAVYLNGKEVGTHMPCFTPGWFDLHGAAQAGENTLVVRVGASPAVLPDEYMSGADYEKRRYIPGIFDSVELILAEAPYIENVQVAPKIDKGEVAVRIELKDALAATAAPVTLEVHEAKSGELVGSTTIKDRMIGPGQTTTVDATVAIKNCKLWSPESPFLYNITVRTAGDTYQTRFGMREFKFVKGERVGRLNGKPYYLRGNNITLYRFFEDSQRGTLPWNEAWVRKMFHLYKETFQWNAYRYCIGFPPEFWYRIADEEGFLIQDEFPAWGEIKSGIATEYAEWMRERWNHPSVVIWDAQNETLTDLTGKATQTVRGLDLSNRPWDNGWCEPQAPTDVWESHPYLFMNGPWTLEKLAKTPADYSKYNTAGNPLSETISKDPAQVAKFADNPVIINEYEWLWVNRDGSPTTLDGGQYITILGADNTPERRFYIQARYNAAVTEFWRMSRYNAGVMHFTALGYSRPDGQTSDFLRDVAKLEIEPHFLKYIPDAFAPVAVALDFWKVTAAPGEAHKIRVVALNDLEPEWNGSLHFRIRKGDEIISEQEQAVQIDGFGKTEKFFECKLPTAPGDYLVEATLDHDGKKLVSSLRDVKIVEAK